MLFWMYSDFEYLERCFLNKMYGCYYMSHLADGVTFDTLKHHLKQEQGDRQILSHNLAVVQSSTLWKKRSLSCLILSCDPDPIESQKKEKQEIGADFVTTWNKQLNLKFNLLYISLIIPLFIANLI